MKLFRWSRTRAGAAYRWIERSTGLLSLLLSFVVAVATVFLWISTRAQVNELRKSSQGTLLVTINRDFFLTDRLYGMRKAIESGGPILKRNRGKFNTQDLDDYIGFFDLLQSLVRRDILARDLLEDNFCDFAVDAYNSKEIHAYIAELRKQPKASDTEKDFEEFAKNCSSKKRG